MIEVLAHQDLRVAEEIYAVFQLSYLVEAEWLGIADFPPLRRTVADLQSSQTSFLGCWKGSALAGILEVEEQPAVSHICSLAVDPRFFRQGVATGLLAFAKDTCESGLLTVETGLANQAANKLYRGFGFEETRRWVAGDIAFVAFSLQR